MLMRMALPPTRGPATAEALLRRIGLAVGKYWVCKRATEHAAEALECLGGNGYVEESGMPRLYREAPLMSIWEGSGNVAALDTLRAMAVGPSPSGVFAELGQDRRADPRLDAHVDGAQAGAGRPDRSTTIQNRGRRSSRNGWHYRVPCSCATVTRPSRTRSGDPAGRQWASRSAPARRPGRRRPSSNGRLSSYELHAIRPVDFDNLKTMTYEVTDRVARITFNRPEKGNAIVADTPLELSALVERADLDPAVHVILVSGRGEGFCAGFDLSAYAEGSSSAGGGSPIQGHRAVGQDAGHQPSARSAVGPDDRLPDDEPVRSRLLQPACTPTSPRWSRSTATASPAAPTSRCTPTR